MILTPIVEIIRLEETRGVGTMGMMRINKQVFCSTLEPTDELNKPRVSSIPAQQYTAVRHQSPKFGECFLVEDVPDRSAILFHPGNRVKDTQGCILLGQYPDKLRNDRAVLNSGATFKKFMDRMTDIPRFHLTIYEHY